MDELDDATESGDNVSVVSPEPLVPLKRVYPAAAYNYGRLSVPREDMAQDVPVTDHGASLGVSQRGRSIPRGTDLVARSGPQVQTQLATPQTERLAASEMRRGEHEATAALKSANAARNAQAKADRDLRNSDLLRQFKGNGAQFYKNPNTQLYEQTIDGETGRPMFHESAWEPQRHPKLAVPGYARRNKFGEQEFRPAPIIFSSDPNDDQGYYHIKETGEQIPAGRITDLVNHPDIAIARHARSANSKRVSEQWKGALEPYVLKRNIADEEYKQAQQSRDAIGQQVIAYQKQMELAPDPTTQAALQASVDRLTEEQTAINQRLLPRKGDLAVARDTAMREHAVFSKKALVERYKAQRGEIELNVKDGAPGAADALRSNDAEQKRAEQSLNAELGPFLQSKAQTLQKQDAATAALSESEPSALLKRGVSKIGALPLMQLAKRYGNFPAGEVPPGAVLKLHQRIGEIDETLADPSNLAPKVAKSLEEEKTYLSQLYDQRFARLKPEAQTQLQEFMANQKTSAGGAFGRAAGGAIPGAVGAVVGGKVGGAVGALGGPAAPVTIPVGAALGALLGSIFADKGARKLAEKAMPETYAKFQDFSAKDWEQHTAATFGGQVAGMAGMFRFNSPQQALQAGRAIEKLAKGGKLTDVEQQTIHALATQAGLSGGSAVAAPLMEGQPLDGQQVLASAAQMLLFGQARGKLGKWAHGQPEAKPGDKEAAPATEAKPAPFVEGEQPQDALTNDEVKAASMMPGGEAMLTPAERSAATFIDTPGEAAFRQEPASGKMLRRDLRAEEAQNPPPPRSAEGQPPTEMQRQIEQTTGAIPKVSPSAEASAQVLSGEMPARSAKDAAKTFEQPPAEQPTVVESKPGEERQNLSTEDFNKRQIGIMRQFREAGIPLNDQTRRGARALALAESPEEYNFIRKSILEKFAPKKPVGNQAKKLKAFSDLSPEQFPRKEPGNEPPPEAAAPAVKPTEPPPAAPGAKAALQEADQRMAQGVEIETGAKEHAQRADMQPQKDARQAEIERHANFTRETLAKPGDKSYKYTVMDAGEGRPKVVQVDIFDKDGNNVGSSWPSELRGLGVDAPEVPADVPMGQYTLDEIKNRSAKPEDKPNARSIESSESLGEQPVGTKGVGEQGREGVERGNQGQEAAGTPAPEGQNAPPVREGGEVATAEKSDVVGKADAARARVAEIQRGMREREGAVDRQIKNVGSAKGIELHSKDGRRYLVTPAMDPDHNGEHQLTWFTKEGEPSGHTFFKSRDEALKSAMGLRTKQAGPPHGGSDVNITRVMNPRSVGDSPAGSAAASELAPTEPQPRGNASAETAPAKGQQGSGEPAIAQQKPKSKSKRIGMPADGEMDILNHVQDLGGIRHPDTLQESKGGEYDEFHRNPPEGYVRSHDAETPLALESASLDQQAKEAEAAREKAAKEKAKEKIAEQSEKRLEGDLGDVTQGGFFEEDRNLFNGPTGEDLGKAAVGEKATKPMPADDARKAVSDWREKNPKAPDVTVVDDPNWKENGRSVRGQFRDGKLTINAAHATDAATVAEIANHEWAHHTLSSNEGRTALATFATRNLPIADISKLAEKYPRRDGETFADHRLRLTEEWIAKNAEKEPGVFKRIVEAVRKWLADRGLATLNNEQAARAMLRALRDGNESAASKDTTRSALADAEEENTSWRTKMVEAWDKARGESDIRDTLAATRDAAENKANQYAREVRNTVFDTLKRSVPEGELKTAQDALTFFIESGDGQAGQLKAMRDKIEASDKASPKWKLRSLAAIDYALTHTKSLTEAASQYRGFTDKQFLREQGAGLPTLKTKNYVPRFQDIDEGSWLDTSGGTSPTGAANRKVRSFETMADSIAAGVDPKTMNAVDALDTRLRTGETGVNLRTWQKSLRNYKDPKTQQPIATDASRVERADGSFYFQAPRGYEVEHVGNTPIAVKKEYSGIVSALTDPSWFSRNSARLATQRVNSLGKSIALAVDTFHLGRLAFRSAMVRAASLDSPKAGAAYREGLTLLEHSPAEIIRMGNTGEIPKENVRGFLEKKQQLGRLIDAGLNTGRVADAMHQELIQHVPLVRDVNKFIFQKFQRGAMADAALLELDRQTKSNPELSEQEVARKVAKEINVRFGNLGRQGIFKSQTAQDLARLIFLAPQWNEGLIRSEIGGVKDIVKSGVNLARGRNAAMGLLGREMVTTALSLFTASQIINQVTRGKFTWENQEEGQAAKISAWIPDKLGGSAGFFFNPLGLTAETAHLLMNAHERTGNTYEPLINYIRSRSSSVGRPAWTFFTGKDSLGRSLKPEQRWTETAKDALPAPISGGAVARVAQSAVSGGKNEKFPGEFQKQALQTFGLRTELAPSPEKRIRALAAEFNRKLGHEPKGEYYVGDYAELTDALRRDNKADVSNALDTLLTKHPADAVEKYYREWQASHFAGSATREATFLHTLNPEQKKQYEAARLERRRLAIKAMQAVRGLPAAKRKPLAAKK